jgi:hypothetical protein
MELRVPLQAQDIGLAFETDGFDQPVVDAARFDAQALAQRADGLVVDGYDLALRGSDKACQKPALPGDGVGVFVVIGVYMPPPARTGFDVLVQRAAERHIDQLAAPADAEDRPAGFHEFVEQLHFVGIALTVADPVGLPRFLAIALRADVGAALQDQAVERAGVVGGGCCCGASSRRR